MCQAKSILDFPDIEKLKGTLLYGRVRLDAEAVTERFIDLLKEEQFTTYYDDAMQCLAIVLPKGKDRAVATLPTLSITKTGCLSNVAENVFAAIKRDHPTLIWTVSEEDENLTWFFEKADGSFKRTAACSFTTAMICALTILTLPIHHDLVANGRDMLGDADLEARLRQTAQTAGNSLNAQQLRD